MPSTELSAQNSKAGPVETFQSSSEPRACCTDDDNFVTEVQTLQETFFTLMFHGQPHTFLVL